MATTKLFPITATESRAISYIADPEKTNNGRLIFTHCCSENPAQASKDFEAVRTNGTGKSKILSQHFIQSFAPGEITPERALEIGIELCDKFLKGEYQYFLAVHTDKSHIHLHCIFNNCNMYDYKTFETHEDQGKKNERAWKKLFDLSDEICKRHMLSVIQHPETSKGKSRWEWDMNRQELSWKAKLKYAIDKVVKESENFEDFLEKCAAHGILVEYNSDHKIDLKFMLAKQKENNPRAKFTRAKTLGWYYATEQIKKRIEQYKGGMAYTPRTKIRQTSSAQVQGNKFIRDSIDRGNMKIASIAKNIIAQYGIEPENIGAAALTAYAQNGKLVNELNTLQTQIEDLTTQLKVLKKYRKVKGVAEELKTLDGRQEKKFRKDHSSELQEYEECRKQILEWYPSGIIPKVEQLEQKINVLKQERSQKNDEYRAIKQEFDDLAKARQEIEVYLKNERMVRQQKKKKRSDLE